MLLENEDNYDKSKAYKHLIGIVLIGIFVSEYNLLGFLYPYFLSYFRLHGNDISMSSMTILPIIWVLTIPLSLVLSLKLRSRIGYKRTIGLYNIVFIIVILLCTQIKNFYLFCFVFGINGGNVQGMFLVFSTMSSWRLFPNDKKAIVNGIIYSCFAFSPFLTSNIVYYSINPNNKQQTVIVEDKVRNTIHKYFDDEVSNNVPNFLMAFSCFSLLFGVIGYSLLANDENYNEKHNDFQVQEKILQLDSSIVNLKNISVKSVIDKILLIYKENKHFFEFSLIVFFSANFFGLMNFSFKTVGLSKLNDDRFVTLIGSIGAIVNCSFRLVLGIIYNHIGFKKLYCFMIVSQIVVCFLFLPLSSSKFFFSILIFLYEICYSSSSIYILVLNNTYKDKSELMMSYIFAYLSVGLCFSMVMFWCLSISQLFFITGLLSVFIFVLMIRICDTFDTSRQ